MMSDIVNTSEQERQTKHCFIHTSISECKESVPFSDKLSHVPLNHKNTSFMHLVMA